MTIKVYMKKKSYPYFCNVINLISTDKVSIHRVLDRNNNEIGILKNYLKKNEQFIPNNNTEIVYI